MLKRQLKHFYEHNYSFFSCFIRLLFQADCLAVHLAKIFIFAIYIWHYYSIFYSLSFAQFFFKLTLFSFSFSINFRGEDTVLPFLWRFWK